MAETSPSALQSASVSLDLPAYFEPYFAPKRYKGLHGGRGSGKSHCFASLAVLRMASEPGFRIACIREVQNSIKDSVKLLIEDKIEAYGLGGFFKVTDAEIEGRNGSRAVFKGMQNHTAAAIKSLEGFDVAWIEEAQTISLRSLELLTPTIRKPRSEIWASWNPDSETDPIDVLLRRHIVQSDDALVREVNFDANPWFPPELRADMERDKARDPDKYHHVWLGGYRQASEARIFRNWRVAEMDPPERAVWFYGVDFGFAVDPTAAVRCCLVEPRTLYVDREAYEVGVPTEALPALLHQVTGIEQWPSRGDSARPETIDYLRRHGIPKMRPAVKGKGSVEDGITFLQGLDIVVSPRCPNLQRELRMYAYKTDKQTGEILPIPEDANNHLIDALRYAVERLHRKGKLVPVAVDEEARNRLPRPVDGYSRPPETDEDSWKVV